MAKQGKNSNYQTEKKLAEKRQAEQKEAQRKEQVFENHKLTGQAKKKLRMKTTQIVCLVLVALLLLSSGATAIYALVSRSSTKTAADYTYPPLYLYDGTYYMVTAEQLYETPEGESSENLTAVVTGDQDTVPVSNGSCNFGKKTVPFLLVDGTVYCCLDDGSYLKCIEFSSESSEGSSEESASGKPSDSSDSGDQ